MRTRITGKRYSTDSAEVIGTYTRDTPDNPSYLVESLYRKRNGEYFLHGKGGKESKYAKQTTSGEWTSGEGITPVSLAVAQKWGAAHLPKETYERFFGDTLDDSKKTLTLRVSASTVEALKRAAGNQKKVISEIAEEAITAYFQGSRELS